MLRTEQTENIARKAYLTFTMNTMKESQVTHWNDLPPLFKDAWARVVTLVEKSINDIKCGQA